MSGNEPSQASVITAEYIRDTANSENRCATCDRAFADAAELQQFVKKQVCTAHDVPSLKLVCCA